MPAPTILRMVTPLDESKLDLPIGAPAQPPLEWFTPPADMGDDTKMTVVLTGPEAGRAYGRVAPRKTCLLSRPDECWTISDSPSGFRNAHQGETVTASGAVIATGNVGGGVRHAPYRASFEEAQDWYENTASRLLRLRYGTDEHGIWAAGAAVASLNGHTALDIMQSPVSGDWRWRRELGDYDMVGVVLVNMPGFPLGANERKAASVWGDPLIGTWIEVEAQVASLFEKEQEACGCETRAAAVSTSKRDSSAAKGHTLPDKSFPIDNRADLKNAIQSFGRAKNKAAAKRHIIARAKALGATSMLPEGWMTKKAASATLVAVPKENEVADEEVTPEYVTLDEANEIATKAAAAAVATAREEWAAEFQPVRDTVDALSAAESERLDATFDGE